MIRWPWRTKALACPVRDGKVHAIRWEGEEGTAGRYVLDGWPLEHADTADPAAGEDASRVFGYDPSDDGPVAAERIRAQAGERLLGAPGRDHGDELALVGHVERIEAQDLAGAAHGLLHGHGGLNVPTVTDPAKP